MAHRSRPFSSALILAAATFVGTPLMASAQVAEDQAVKEVENSKYSTSGLIISNAVFVRCGPGENYYSTMKLDKGAKVTVVGAKFDWLKIVPPEGSFCYVARLYVDRHGDGKVGRVNKDAINVRAGSSLSALKIGILCELSQGEEVEILGEEQEYFKVKPPAKAYLYVNKKFVEPDPDAKPLIAAKTDQSKVADPVKPEPESPDFAKADPPKPEAIKPETIKPEAIKDPATPDATAKTDPPVADPLKPEAIKPEMIKPEVVRGADPDPSKIIDPATPDSVKPEAVKPEAIKPETVKPETIKVDPLSTPELAEAAYDKAEASYLATRTQPLDQQPVADLLKQYEALSKSEALPESMRRVAESRQAGLKARVVAQAELTKLKTAESTWKQRQQALLAEQEELQKRIAENTVKVYTAVGTLQPSSLQMGKGTLYRITDPATGRTVCYLRSDDPKTVQQLGQFVGVKGAMAEEQRLGGKVITPVEITACDPGKVHTTITAQIIPPSLLPHEPAQANTDLRPVQP